MAASFSVNDPYSFFGPCMVPPAHSVPASEPQTPNIVQALPGALFPKTCPLTGLAITEIPNPYREKLLTHLAVKAAPQARRARLPFSSPAAAAAALFQARPARGTRSTRSSRGKPFPNPRTPYCPVDYDYDCTLQAGAARASEMAESILSAAEYAPGPSCTPSPPLTPFQKVDICSFASEDDGSVGGDEDCEWSTSPSLSTSHRRCHSL